MESIYELAVLQRFMNIRFDWFAATFGCRYTMGAQTIIKIQAKKVNKENIDLAYNKIYLYCWKLTEWIQPTTYSHSREDLFMGIEHHMLMENWRVWMQ